MITDDNKNSNNNVNTGLTEQAWQELIHALHPSDISLRVELGIVTLQGTVETYARKLLAENIVAEVSGVRSIVNELRVIAAGKKQDRDLLNRVREALNDDFFVKAPQSTEELQHLPYKEQHHPALLTTSEWMYWEVFC